MWLDYCFPLWNCPCQIGHTDQASLKITGKCILLSSSLAYFSLMWDYFFFNSWFNLAVSFLTVTIFFTIDLIYLIVIKWLRFLFLVVLVLQVTFFLEFVNLNIIKCFNFFFFQNIFHELECIFLTNQRLILVHVEGSAVLSCFQSWK